MRQFPRVVAVAALALVLSGCGPVTTAPHHSLGSDATVAPTSLPPHESSDVSEADVQAAKQAYLDYTDAIGRMDPKDRASFEPAFALATGEQLKEDRDFYEQLADKNWTVSGEPKVKRIDFIGADSATTIQLSVCMDSSAVRFFDAEGNERQASPVRVQLLTATLTRDPRDIWLVAAHSASKEPQPC